MQSNSVPLGWLDCSLGNAIVRVVGGGTPSRSIPGYWVGNIPWASVKDFTDDTKWLSETEEHISPAGLASSTANLIEPGIPIVCTRMAVGRAAIPLKPIAINQDLKALYPHKYLDPRYLLILLNFIRPRFEALSIGSTVKGINVDQLLAVRVCFPPLDEQRRIVEILDTIDSTIAHTSSLIAKLKQMKAGLLHDLLTRGLDENGELRDAIGHPEQFQDSPLGQIPKDWNVRLVGEVFDLQLGKMLSKASKIGHSPFPYLANRNVQWDEVVLSDLEWMDFNDNEREKFSLLPGDLLVCEGGESGRTALWKGEMENCYFQKAIHRLRPKDSQVLPDYMLRFMRRAFEHGFLTSFTSQTSITHLTREKFALLPLPLPKVEEQKAIVNVLDSLDTSIRTEEAYREKLKLQKKGLMHDLLTGKVRVKNA